MPSKTPNPEVRRRLAVRAERKSRIRHTIARWSVTLFVGTFGVIAVFGAAGSSKSAAPTQTVASTVNYTTTDDGTQVATQSAPSYQPSPVTTRTS